MRFHVVSLPHTHTISDYSSCAFTQKVIRFCQMMKGLGHTVFLYSGEENEAPCDEHISCISEEHRREIVGDKHFTEADWYHGRSKMFNTVAASHISARIEQKDFICVIGGYSQKIFEDIFPNNHVVEFGIGYSGTFAKFRVFESYAWMHMIYGAESGGPEKKDGHWYDAVIPNQVDPNLFPYADGEGDEGGGYYLYIGRLIDRKGYSIAQDVCKRLGKRLIVAGPGEFKGYGEHVGEVGPEGRAKLMGGAIALFAPTLYVEPFGTVAIEAMATGTPVISTDWGAFTETIKQGQTGFRCRTLKEFMNAAVDVAFLDREYIREYALNNYSMDVIAGAYEDYFNRLLSLWDKGWYQE